MTAQPEPLSDEVFLAQFEDKTLDPVHLNHLGHLRLAWLYLLHSPFDEALKRISQGIKAYAESLGATQKFHVTVTEVIVKIMAQRIAAMPEKNWTLFIRNNPDLLEDMESVLLQYYSKVVLFSDVAKTRFVAPDIQPI